MKGTAWIAILVFACVPAAWAGRGPVTTPHGRVVNSMPLQAYFHAQHPWQVKIYATPGGGTDGYAAHPVYVCFIERGANVPPPPHGRPSPFTQCATLGQGTYAMRSFAGAKLEMLPGPVGEGRRPTLIIHAAWSAGGSGFLSGVYLFNYMAATDQFEQTFQSVTDNNGTQELVTKGPLAGTFIKADQVYEGNEPNMASPLHYEIEVYAPASRGYVRVLGMATKQRYPSFRSGDMLRDPIAKLTPEISHALKAIYAGDIAAVEK